MKKRIAAAAAATAALTTGALVFASPAMAVANPTYSCTGGWGSISTEFDRVSGNLQITADIPATYTAAYNTALTTTLGSSSTPGPSASLTPGTYDSVTLTGSYTTLSSAPAIHLKADPTTGPDVFIDCTVSSGGTGWPI